MSTFQAVSSGDEHVSRFALDAWNPLPGGNEFWVPDEHFLFYSRDMMIRGDNAWPPSIISYYGHPIPLPNIEMQYLSRGKTFLKVLVTFTKREIDAELGMFVDSYMFTVPAWQGENNLIHLIESLPGETPEDINLNVFEEEADDIDADYLTRMRQVYTDEELNHLAPEVFNYEDPVLGGNTPDW